MEKGFNISTLVAFCNFKNASPKHFHQEIWMRRYWKHENVHFLKNTSQIILQYFKKTIM